jgi:Holliday junction DNA helicase RuvB
MNSRTEAAMDKQEKNKNISIERYVSPQEMYGDTDIDTVLPTIRPSHFDDYPGQKKVIENLKVYVSASIKRGLPLDHVILHGPPGLGKTTLARIIANELNVPFYQTSGPSIGRPGDLAGILTGIESRGVLFIDEIHRLSIEVEEILYSAMEDFNIDILIGQGQTSRAVKVPINPFTLIGATTRVASLSSPLLTRFGIQERLDFYGIEALATILKRSSTILGIELEDDGAVELAKRSRGTPRIANRLLRRARDFADYSGTNKIDAFVVIQTVERLDVDELGLDRMDRLILETVLDRYQGGPVGLETLSATIGEEKSTIEEVYEPYLLHSGLLTRGPRGREISSLGKQHLMNIKQRQK